MTIEEAIEELKAILSEATAEEYSVCYVTNVDEIPLKMAIEALENQMKIRADAFDEIIAMLEEHQRTCEDLGIMPTLGFIKSLIKEKKDGNTLYKC